VQNGSNRSRASGFFNPDGLVQIYTIKKRKLVKVTEAVQGGWQRISLGWRVPRVARAAPRHDIDLDLLHECEEIRSP